MLLYPCMCTLYTFTFHQYTYTYLQYLPLYLHLYLYTLHMLVGIRHLQSLFCMFRIQNPLTTIRHIDIQFKILSQIAYWFSSEFPPPNRKIYLSTLLKVFYSGRGSVGRAVASDTRDPRFESNHRQILFAINIIKDFFSQKVQVLFTTIKFN